MIPSAPPAPAAPEPPPPARARWQVPRLDPDDGWVGGVAAAVAREVGVQTLVVRAVFVLLALAGGWTLLLYGAAWLALAVVRHDPTVRYEPEPKGASPTHRYLAFAMISLGVLLVLRRFAFGYSDRIVIPAGFIAVGFLIAWTRHRAEAGIWSVLRILAGVVVGVGGMVAYVALSAPLVDTLLFFLVALAVVSGVGIVAAPSLARIGRELDDERQNRVRADERALMAAHLHDSVLQTLALIQRHADDPTRTSQLARRQERELRTWLFRPQEATAGPTQLGPALDAMAAEVDEIHGVAATVIMVGDQSTIPAEATATLVAASREAVVNAAKHSGASQIDVFAERHADRVEIFVRDTGCGFSPDETANDRRGIAESIVGRMTRAGGDAIITSEPGAGTEVELVLPITRSNRTDEPATRSEQQ